MSLTDILLFLILSILVSSYFNYFGTSAKSRTETPEIILIRWLVWIVVLAVAVALISYGVNYF